MTQDQHENIYESENADKTVSDLFSGQLSLDQALQKLRTKLLDLTSRNRLLNYKHPKGRSIQFVNKPNLNLIFNRLIDSKSLLIKYVSDPPQDSYETKRPDVKTFAQSIGIDVDSEFPPACCESSANRHTPRLQVLYYPADLDKLCRKIGSESRTVIEETGTNMLYLIFGFLEFYERDDSEKSQIAPLLAVPVTLEKGAIDEDSRTYQYSITYSGEDVHENQTLREKLSRDFSFQLPAFDEEDDPGTYLAKIQQAIQKKKRWKVRYQLTLGFLSFGKLAIWVDLDSKKWPGLLNHPLLNELFSGSSGKGAGLFPEDYDIDKHTQGDLPLIYDADSSQHSAIIDVLSGKNMVINGPPGTGKSQTITNIIAAGLKEGKKILFVSDKLAALEVVRHRLNHANLGHFCLELHSHKTQKKKLLGDLQERLYQRFRPQQQLQDKISTLKRHKKELNRYAELMSIRVGNELGLTIYEVFWRTERRRRAIGDMTNIVQSLSFSDATNWSYDDIEQRRAKLEAIGQLYVAIGSFDSANPWWGFTPRPLAPGDDETIGRIVLDASALATQLTQFVSNYQDKTGDSAEPSLAKLDQLHKAMQNLPAPPDNLKTELLSRVFTVESPYEHKRGLLKEFIHKVERARELNAKADALLEVACELAYDSIESDVSIYKKKLSTTAFSMPLDSLAASVEAARQKLDQFKHIVSGTYCAFEPICDRNLESLDAKLKEAHPFVLENHPFHNIIEGASLLQRLTTRLEQSRERIAHLGRLDGIADVTDDVTIAKNLVSELTLNELSKYQDAISLLEARINRVLDEIGGYARQIGIPLDASPKVVTQLIVLTQIASQAPADLLDYRCSSLAHPRILELVKTAEEMHSLEKSYREALATDFYLDALPSLGAIKAAIRTFRCGDSLFNFLKSDWRAAKKLFRGICKTKANRKATDLEYQFSRIVSWMEHRASFVSDKGFKDAFGTLFKGLETDFSKIHRLHNWYVESHAEMLKYPGFIDSVNLSSLDSRKINQLAALRPRLQILSAELDTCCQETGRLLGQLKRLTQATNDLEEMLAKYGEGYSTPGNIRSFFKAKLALDVAMEKLATLPKIDSAASARASTLHCWTASGWTAVATSWVSYIDIVSRRVSIAAELVGLLRPAGKTNKTVDEVVSGLKARKDAVGIIKDLTNDADVTTMLQCLFQGIETDLESLAATLSWGEAVIENELVRSSSLGTLMLGLEAASNFSWAKMKLQQIVELREDIKIKLSELVKFGTFKWDVWNWVEELRSKNLLERIAVAASNIEAVLPWSKYNADRVNCEKSGLGDFVDRLEQKKLPPLSVGSVFEFVAYRSIGRNIYKNYPELEGFSGATHEKKRSEFVALDKEIISLTGKSFAHDIDKAKKVPDGDSGYRASERTELQLLLHEFGKQRRHLPIRQLIKRAGRAIQALKPCFMMGPMSVAQYLEQDAVEFDMIVMDEASQLRPEEALGVIARGKQLVVVGDPKQLPPTNFFDRMVDDCDEDDDDTHAVLAGSESILDICQQLFHPVRSLRWHYRSQHESLIAFSNYHFYNGKLVVFPSPFERNNRLGVRYRYIKNGIYQNRQNFPEAQRVVDHVIEHMMKHPEESLGVVTLNQTQRDLIEDLLDKKLRNIDEAQTFISKWESEGWPFFVKNLENVQGDERDVIFISTTFGRALGTDKVRQNFGPISRPDGWRRLNVLFTRARRKIELFTSMLPEDIVLETKTPAGTRALKDYLDFAKRGVLTTTDISGREADSDFELAVGDILRNRGYDVVPQLGVASFFIDLAVRNPDRPGEFLAAIECDGAAYHSSNSARDRDRIREDILKSLGWKDRIWRIWSTDWFYDPRRESARLLTFLEQRRAVVKSEPLPEYDFEDKEETTEVEPATLTEEPQELTESVPSISAEELFVEVGDYVTYCFADKPDERHSMMIVDTESDPRQNIINENTPLAKALLDSAVGDEVGDEPELEIKGRPTRVIRILKIQRQAPNNLSPLINAGVEEGIVKEKLPETKSDRSIEFMIGERVCHPDFGTGIVLETEGAGENEKVIIKFETVGIKKLAVKFAKLERIT